MDKYWVIARRKGEESPFVYVRCEERQEERLFPEFYRNDNSTFKERAEYIQKILQRLGYEAHIVNDKGLVNFPRLELSDLLQ